MRRCSLGSFSIHACAYKCVCVSVCVAGESTTWPLACWSTEWRLTGGSIEQLLVGESSEWQFSGWIIE